jgi:hypothetical protein
MVRALAFYKLFKINKSLIATSTVAPYTEFNEVNYTEMLSDRLFRATLESQTCTQLYIHTYRYT